MSEALKLAEIDTYVLDIVISVLMAVCTTIHGTGPTPCHRSVACECLLYWGVSQEP